MYVISCLIVAKMGGGFCQLGREERKSDFMTMLEILEGFPFVPRFLRC